jgi:hypothetical protein
MSVTPAESYAQICFYTLSLRDKNFIHQHVVDAYAAQDASATDKPIRLFFALVGLFLLVEKGFSGRQVQQAHQRLANSKDQWPTFELRSERGSITAVEVERAQPGSERDELIYGWCRSVWKSFSHTRSVIEPFLKKCRIID